MHRHFTNEILNTLYSSCCIFWFGCCSHLVTSVMSAEKPALDPNTVKMWMLSANDMNDDDLVSCDDVGVLVQPQSIMLCWSEALCFPSLCRIWWTQMLFWMKMISRSLTPVLSQPPPVEREPARKRKPAKTGELTAHHRFQTCFFGECNRMSASEWHSLALLKIRCYLFV